MSMSKKNCNKYKRNKHQQINRPSEPNKTNSMNEPSPQSNEVPEAGRESVEKDMNNTQNIVINSKITAKDIRDSLWRCRDFELSHLWQRSIFLTTILLLCFTGYGIVTIKLFDNIEYTVESSAYILNNVALVLCLVNIIFSCLWIMMAKGSKAWYERYEKAIDAFDYNEKYVNDEVIKTGVNTYDNGTNPIGGFQYPNLLHYVKPEIKDCIFSCKGGAYSPSKINIAIGQIAFVIWCLVFGIHFYLSTCDFRLDPELLKSHIPVFLLFIFIIILILIFVSVWMKGIWVKSSVLGKKEEEKKKQEKNTAPK